MTTIKTGFVAILLAACGGTEAAPNKPASAPAAVLKAGTGIRIDAASEVISVDDAVVPTGANCAAGQILQRTATGWACASAAPDSAMLGGQPASAYLTQQATAANSAKLEGHPAADFLGSHATAVNAALLNGHPDSDFLAAAGTAVNSAALNGHPDSDFLAATGTAADSSKLGGQLPSYYLAATAKAADSSKLNGQPASYYLAASATAADSSKLGSVSAANYARLDVANTMRGPLSIRDSKDTSWYGTIYAGDVTGGDSLGNVHIYGDDTKGDGRVYLNWFGGNGVRFGNGAQSKVADIDGSGNVTAASYNGIQLSVVQATFNDPWNCQAACWTSSSSSNALCVAAMTAPSGTASWSPRLCTDIVGTGNTFKCVCAKL